MSRAKAIGSAGDSQQIPTVTSLLRALAARAEARPERGLGAGEGSRGGCRAHRGPGSRACHPWQGLRARLAREAAGSPDTVGSTWWTAIAGLRFGLLHQAAPVTAGSQKRRRDKPKWMNPLLVPRLFKRIRRLEATRACRPARPAPRAC